MPFRKRCKPEKLHQAKFLRHNPTKAEAMLWNVLRSRPNGLKFRRQEIILGWITDFYCSPAKLVIEIDGDYHLSPEQLAKDNYRDQIMRGKGLRVVRFTNNSILNNQSLVVSQIIQLCKS